MSYRSKIYLKSILLGLLIAILVSSGSLYMASIPNNLIDTDLDTPTWDFSTGLSLSSGMITRDHQVLMVVTQVERITWISETGRSSSPVPIFDKYTSGLSSAIIAEDTLLEHWVMQSDPEWEIHFSSDLIDNHRTFNTSYDTLYNLSNALALDISELSGLTDYSPYTPERVENNLEVGSIYWQITLIYRDGTIFQIEIIDQTFFILYYQLVTLHPQGDGFVIGKVRHGVPDDAGFYKGEFDGSVFVNYINTINGVINSHV